MPSADVTLGLRNLYILPSRFGLLWLSVAGLLLLVANQTTSNKAEPLPLIAVETEALPHTLTQTTIPSLPLWIPREQTSHDVDTNR